jgi:phage tail-like protein
VLVPRSVLFDRLQNFPFWLFDVAPIEALSLPIFTPLMGFASCSMPEIRLEVQDIPDGNWFFKRKVVTGAEVATLTLTRGATFIDSDFYRWLMAALTGDTSGKRYNLPGALSNLLQIGGPTPRRRLVLVQFFSRSPFANKNVTAAATALGLSALAGVAATGTGLGAAQAAGQVALTTAAAFSSNGIGPFEFAPRLPARAWLLHGCLPSRYKPGGDLDASDSGISIAELDIEVEMAEEISLTAT